MNLKHLVAVFIAAGCLSASASAIQFATGGSRGHMFLTLSGSRVPAGSLVRVGYVTTPNDVSTFAEFATTTISNPGPDHPIGGFLTIPAENSTVAAAAKAKQIYLWVYNASTVAAATESAIFTSTHPSWVIPASFTGDPTETHDLSLSLPEGAVTAIRNPHAPGWWPPTYHRGPIIIGGTVADGAIYSLSSVPEPGMAALLFLSLAASGSRRRRRLEMS